MDKAFEIEIVTPGKSVFTGKVTSVICPGTEGRFQVLYNHAPFLSSLSIGEMDVYDEQGEKLVYAIGGGVSRINQNKMLILADSAELADEINIVRAKEAKKRAEQRIDSHSSDTDLDRARMALLRAINRLKIAGRS